MYTAAIISTGVGLLVAVLSVILLGNRAAMKHRLVSIIGTTSFCFGAFLLLRLIGAEARSFAVMCAAAGLLFCCVLGWIPMILANYFRNIWLPLAIAFLLAFVTYSLCRMPGGLEGIHPTAIANLPDRIVASNLFLVGVVGGMLVLTTVAWIVRWNVLSSQDGLDARGASSGATRAAIEKTTPWMAFLMGAALPTAWQLFRGRGWDNIDELLTAYVVPALIAGLFFAGTQKLLKGHPACTKQAPEHPAMNHTASVLPTNTRPNNRSID